DNQWIRQRGHVIWRVPTARVSHVPVPWGRFYHRFTEMGRDAARWNKLQHPQWPMLLCVALALRGKAVRTGKNLRMVAQQQPRKLVALPFALPIVVAALALHALGAASALLPEKE